MHIGFFKVIIPAGAVRLFGEKLEIVPPGFKKVVTVGVWRYQDGPFRYAASVFATGDLLAYGETQELVLKNAQYHLERMGEERFEAEQDALPVINESIEIAGV